MPDRHPNSIPHPSQNPSLQIPLEFLYLCDVQLLTPLGMTPEFVYAAVKAQINSYQMCSLPGEHSTPVKFSSVPAAALTSSVASQLPGLSAPQVRALKIAATCLGRMRGAHPIGDLPIFIAGPDPYYDQSTFNRVFFEQLIKATGGGIDLSSSQYFAAGRAGMFYAIAAAFDYLAAYPEAIVLVAGIDTFYDARTLGILAEQNRLSAEGVIDGFVPAEGAAFMLLSTRNGPAALLNSVKLKLSRPSLAYEPGHIFSNSPRVAHALSAVITEAMGSACRLIDKIYTSENGESFYGKEFTVARLRNNHKLHPGVTVCRLTEFAGDMGAAYPGVALALAGIDCLTSAAQSILICGSSDKGARGAVCVSPA